MDDKELKNILEKHRKWVYGKDGGECADLRGADLRCADLSFTDLRGANLRGADLSFTDLKGANLKGADLSYGKLSDADLSDADLSNIIVNAYTTGYFLVCPEKGSFIGFKKVGNYIIELEIPANAKRSSATTRKCRCEFAKVLSITNIDGSDSGLTEVVNCNYKRTIYKVGEMVYPDSFDENRWNGCSNGIHFFITREETVLY